MRLETLPKKPGLTRRGCYKKDELRNYLIECDKLRAPLYLIAEHLRVPLDRIIYITGDGWSLAFGEVNA
jgi:hypothetical protein